MLRDQMMPGEMPFGRDLTIKPVLGHLGVRIVLDLSDFGGLRPERRLRCVFLPREKFTSVKDVKRHVRKSILKTEAKIQLFLGGKFWIPNAESIHVLQNDDVVVVRQKLQSPCRSQSSEGLRKRSFSNTAHKMKNGNKDKSSSGESDSDTDFVSRQKNGKRLVTSKGNTSSSSTESSDSDCKQGKQERKVATSGGHRPSNSLSSTRSSVRNSNELAKERAQTSNVPSINPKAAKKRAASSESETDSRHPENPSTVPNQESNLTPELTKRKRKRQRKSKNKNKISNPECEPMVEDQLASKPNLKKKEVHAPSLIPVPAVRTLGTSKKIYFEECEDGNAVSPTTALTTTLEQESQSTSRPTVMVTSRSFDPGSSHVTCEEAMLVGSHPTGGAKQNGYLKTTYKTSVKSPIVIASRHCAEPPNQAPARPEESNVTYDSPTSFPMLKEPPQLGMHVAFKILTMSSDYTPGVSDYIFGVVVSNDGFSLSLRITHDENPVEARSGKFECEEETEDDLIKKGKILEYKWQDMIDARHVEPRPSSK